MLLEKAMNSLIMTSFMVNVIRENKGKSIMENCSFIANWIIKLGYANYYYIWNSRIIVKLVIFLNSRSNSEQGKSICCVRLKKKLSSDWPSSVYFYFYNTRTTFWKETKRKKTLAILHPQWQLRFFSPYWPNVFVF